MQPPEGARGTQRQRTSPDRSTWNGLADDDDLVFEAAELRADPGLTLLLATAQEASPTEAALHRLAATTTRVE